MIYAAALFFMLLAGIRYLMVAPSQAMCRQMVHVRPRFAEIRGAFCFWFSSLATVALVNAMKWHPSNLSSWLTVGGGFIFTIALWIVWCLASRTALAFTEKGLVAVHGTQVTQLASEQTEIDINGTLARMHAVCPFAFDRQRIESQMETHGVPIRYATPTSFPAHVELLWMLFP